MVYRIFVEKKPGQTHEADKLLKDVQEFLQIASLKSVRVINRYDVENIPLSIVVRSGGGLGRKPCQALHSIGQFIQFLPIGNALGILLFQIFKLAVHPGMLAFQPCHLLAVCQSGGVSPDKSAMLWVR